MTVVNKQIIDCCHYFCWCEHIKTQICHANTSDLYAEKTWRDKLDFPDKLKDLEPLWNPSQQFVPKTKLCIFYNLKIALVAIYSSLDEFHLYLRNLFFILERQMIETPNDWILLYLLCAIDTCEERCVSHLSIVDVHRFLRQQADITANNIPHICNSSLLIYLHAVQRVSQKMF